MESTTLSLLSLLTMPGACMYRLTRSLAVAALTPPAPPDVVHPAPAAGAGTPTTPDVGMPAAVVATIDAVAIAPYAYASDSVAATSIVARTERRKRLHGGPTALGRLTRPPNMMLALRTTTGRYRSS